MKKIFIILMLCLLFTSCKSAESKLINNLASNYSKVTDTFKTYTVSKSLIDNNLEEVYIYTHTITKLDTKSFSVNKYEKVLNQFPNINKYKEEEVTYLTDNLENYIVMFNININYFDEIEYNKGILSFSVTGKNIENFLGINDYSKDNLLVTIKYENNKIIEIICAYVTTNDFNGKIAITISY